MNNTRDDLPVCTQENFLVSLPNRKGLIELSSFVCIAGMSARIALQAEKKILDEISALPEHRVKDCLYGLLKHYIQQRTNTENWKFPGKNSQFSRVSWLTARFLLPLLVTWAEKPQTPQTNSYKKIVRALHSEGFQKIDALRVVAFVMRINIENYGKPEGKLWPGNDPCIDPKKFKRQLEKQKPEVLGIGGQQGGRVNTLLRDNFSFPDNLQPHMPTIVEFILDGEYLVAHITPRIEIPLMKF